MGRFLPEYATASPIGQARVRQMFELGGQYGAGTGWMNIGGLTGLSDQGYGVFGKFYGTSLSGWRGDEFSSLFRTGIQP